MKKSLLATSLICALSTPAFASTTADQAIDALQASVANAELAISEVRTQEAINHLTASVAGAELAITVASAEDSIRAVRGQEALNSLMASVADAELTVALAEGSEAIKSVSDSQMLAELDSSLQHTSDAEANDLIVAVVGERPVLASAVQDIAIGAGLNEGLVASAIMGGLGDAPATAAGK